MHCSSQVDARISVQFMEGELTAYSLPRHFIEPLLRAHVVVDRAEKARMISAIRDMAEAWRRLR